MSLWLNGTCYLMRTLFFLCFVQDIALKTKELLGNLKSLATPGGNGKPEITLETLKERKMAPATMNFLFNLAVAEGLR